MHKAPTPEEIAQTRIRSFEARLSDTIRPTMPGEKILYITYDGETFREIPLTPTERLKVIQVLLMEK